MQSFMHFSQHTEQLIELVLIAADFIGILFIFRALIKLKIYGEMRSMMTPHGRLNQILLLFAAGAFLIYLPYETKPLLTETMFGIKGLSYHDNLSAQTAHEEIQMAATKVMAFIGHIALIRGILQMGTYQEGGRHSLGKAITHVVAGVCAINIEQTRTLLNDLVGL